MISRFLASNPNPQQVVDFIVYILNLPKLALKDAETTIKACEQVKDTNTKIKKLGYWYDSQFIIYETMFWMYLKDAYGHTEDAFHNAVKIGLEAAEKLGEGNQDGIRMARRTELLLRYPETQGFPNSFKNEQQANEIKEKRLKGTYNKQECFEDYVNIDLKEAASYTQKDTRQYYYCQLYLNKDKEALDYFRQEWEKANPAKQISLGLNYLHALQEFDPPAAKEFEGKLEEIIKEKGDAQGFTHWARMDLRKYSPINGFSVIPWVIAGRDEPSKENIESSLRHCDQGLAKIEKMENTGPYEYRNRVFLYETKGWVHAHLKEKVYDNYVEALRSYQQALRLYVNVDDYYKQLQFAEGRYVNILKEILILFAAPERLDFDSSFKNVQGTNELYKSFISMFAGAAKSFPYMERLQQSLEAGVYTEKA